MSEGHFLLLLTFLSLPLIFNFSSCPQCCSLTSARMQSQLLQTLSKQADPWPKPCVQASSHHSCHLSFPPPYMLSTLNGDTTLGCKWKQSRKFPFGFYLSCASAKSLSSSSSFSPGSEGASEEAARLLACRLPKRRASLRYCRCFLLLLLGMASKSEAQVLNKGCS